MKAILNINGTIGRYSEDMPHTDLISLISDYKKFDNPTELELNINSPGGFVTEGNNIYNWLKSLNIPITTIAEVQCCSIATKLFLSGDVRKVTKGCEFMIHNPWVSVEGDANLLEMVSKEMRKDESDLINFYSERLNVTKEAIKPFCDEERFFTSEELVALGFATELIDEENKEKPKYKALAITNLNLKNEMSEQVTKNDLNSLFEKIKNFLKIEPKGLTLQDAEGNELVFPEIEEGQEVTVDSVVEANDGEYLMPDETIIVVSGSKVTEIREKEDEVDIDEIMEELASLRKKEEKYNELLDEVKAMKKKISGYSHGNTKEPKGSEIINDAKNVLAKLKNKK